MLPLLSTPAEAAAWLRAHGSRLQTDSRRLEAGDLFVAWPGAAHDARVHVLAALQGLTAQPQHWLTLARQSGIYHAANQRSAPLAS